jgi:hypothetical protein
VRPGPRAWCAPFRRPAAHPVRQPSGSSVHRDPVNTGTRFAPQRAGLTYAFLPMTKAAGTAPRVHDCEQPGVHGVGTPVFTDAGTQPFTTTASAGASGGEDCSCRPAPWQDRIRHQRAGSRSGGGFSPARHTALRAAPGPPQFPAGRAQKKRGTESRQRRHVPRRPAHPLPVLPRLQQDV